MFNSFSQIPSSLEGSFIKKPVKRCILEFGFMISGFLTLVALYNFIRYADVYKGTLYLIISLLFLSLSKFMPTLILPLWRLWMMLALLMSKVMTPVILMIMWFFLVIPTGLALRAFKKKVIDEGFRDPSKSSYFTLRTPKDNDFSFLNRQF